MRGQVKRHLGWSLSAIVLVGGIAIPVGVATAAVKIPTHGLSAKGGTVTFSTTVNNAKSCAWSSSPKVVGFDATVKCGTGKVARSAKVKANSLTKTRDYMLTLTVKGKTTTVDHLKVDEAGKTVAVTSVPGTTTPTTTIPTTTTTTTQPAASQVYTVLGWTATGSNGLVVTYTASFILTSVPSGTLTISAAGVGQVCTANVVASATSVQCSTTYSAPGAYQVSATFSSTGVTNTVGPFYEQVGPTSETLNPNLSASYTGTSDLTCGMDGGGQTDYCSSFSATLNTSGLPAPEGSSWSTVGHDVEFSYYAGNQQWVGFAGGSFSWVSGSSSISVSGAVPKQTSEVEVVFQGTYTDTLGESIILGPETVIVYLSPPLW
jgi:hypothetical protein